MPEDSTPSHSQGFGPAEQADETRQAQQTVSNDAPTDVNFNAVVARSQQLTLDIGGKNYEANANRLNALMNHMASKLTSA